MKQVFLIAVFMLLSPQAFSTIESPLLTLEVFQPETSDTVKVTIAEKDEKKFEITYSVTGPETTAKTSGSYEKDVIDELLKKIEPKSKPFSAWASDRNCFQTKTWKIELKKEKKQICRNTEASTRLTDFTRALGVLMRDRPKSK